MRLRTWSIAEHMPLADYRLPRRTRSGPFLPPHMWRIAIYLYVVILGFCIAASAHAGVLKAPAEDLEISLVTFGPGAIYWERFGHNAIRMRDRVSGESGDINYGVFDFSDSTFLRNFARGHMRYMIDIGSSETNQQDYIDAGRSVLVQRLSLSPAQAAALRAYLLWNLQPENQSYDYDYLTSNCSTRIRDALNTVLGGALQPPLVARSAPLTYRGQIDRLMNAQRWLMLLMDLGLGPSADRPLNEWQESFIPMVLARELRTVQVPDGHGGFQPLVAEEHEISPSLVDLPKAEPPRLAMPLGIAGLSLALAILLSRRRLPTVAAALSVAFLAAAGIVGTVLLALWTLTIHYAAWSNANLLLFNPLAFLVVAAAWRTRDGRPARLPVQIFLGLQVAAVLVGYLIHLLPGTPQQNLPWLLFATPVWLAIAGGMIARRGPASSGLAQASVEA
jgi:hypothetical protein